MEFPLSASPWARLCVCIFLKASLWPWSFYSTACVFFVHASHANSNIRHCGCILWGNCHSFLSNGPWSLVMLFYITTHCSLDLSYYWIEQVHTHFYSFKIQCASFISFNTHFKYEIWYMPKSHRMGLSNTGKLLIQLHLAKNQSPFVDLNLPCSSLLENIQRCSHYLGQGAPWVGACITVAQWSPYGSDQ